MNIDIKKILEKTPALMLSNKGLKVLSVLLAIMCWYGIRSVIDSDQALPKSFSFRPDQEQNEFELVLPVRAVFSGGTRAFDFELEPDRAVVRFVGDVQQRDLVTFDNIALYVDCAGLASSGSYRLPIRFFAPQEFNIIDISPADVIVKIEFNEER